MPWQYCLDLYFHLLDLLFSKSAPFSDTLQHSHSTGTVILLILHRGEPRAQGGEVVYSSHSGKGIPGRSGLEPTSTHAPNHLDGNGCWWQLCGYKGPSKGPRWIPSTVLSGNFPWTLSITGHLILPSTVLLLSLKGPSGLLFASTPFQPQCPLRSAP